MQFSEIFVNFRKYFAKTEILCNFQKQHNFQHFHCYCYCCTMVVIIHWVHLKNDLATNSKQDSLKDGSACHWYFLISIHISHLIRHGLLAFARIYVTNLVLSLYNIQHNYTIEEIRHFSFLARLSNWSRPCILQVFSFRYSFEEYVFKHHWKWTT